MTALNLYKHRGLVFFMNVKSGVLIFILCITLVSLVSAEENDTEAFKISKAYTCLENGINNKTTITLSLQESVFGVLALGNNVKAVQKLDSENRSMTSNQTCWPRSACTIKETAQALLAYRVLGRDTKKIENWLLSKSGATTGLTWFLEIDVENHEAAVCHIKYSSTDYTLAIGSDMKLTSDLLGPCLSIVPSGYWLEIAPSCLDYSYEVSCNKDFLTTLLYKQSDSDTLFVSPNTQSKPADGTTNESITSRCFKNDASSDCDYEGSLWATTALDAAGTRVTSYVPYLAAFAESQEEYFPEAFLFKLTGGQDYYTRLIEAQRSRQFWEAAGSEYNRFYDTALALLALQKKTSVAEVSNAKNYLLEVQGANGCWDNNNFRSTAFILYAGWPGGRPGGSNGGSGDTPGPGSNASSVESCIDASPAYSCVESILQCIDAQGEELRNYDCPGTLFCCSKTPVQPSCASLNGNKCSLSEECTGTPRDSADGQCCIGSCVPRTQPSVNECEDNNGFCTTGSCEAGETEENYACVSSSETCCVPEGTGTDNSSSSNLWLWIGLLLILILIVVLAIVYRKKLQMMFHKGRRPETSSSSPIMVRRPSFPPSSPAQSYGVRPQPAAQARRPTSQVDKEMEETLRKLREMSK